MLSAQNSNFRKSLIHVIDSKYSKSDFMPLDLSVNNKALSQLNMESSHELQTYIQSLLKKHNKKVAIGGYLEERNLYQRSTHFNSGQKEARNIHLGVDLWVDAGTAVLAAFEGKVHSFNYNNNYGDYGPTILLEHQLDEQHFHTLYGHLSLESLNHLEIGQIIGQEDRIGWIGNTEVNGDYPPHLHFQLIWDLQGMEGDYPGVCTKSELEFYKMNCPDPMKILV
ncbi:MAG: peptidoglycan DD-metalloendopeptidase family protein [Crocinitomicaceae bacterium]